MPEGPVVQGLVQIQLGQVSLNYDARVTRWPRFDHASPLGFRQSWSNRGRRGPCWSLAPRTTNPFASVLRDFDDLHIL